MGMNIDRGIRTKPLHPWPRNLPKMEIKNNRCYALNVYDTFLV